MQKQLDAATGQLQVKCQCDITQTYLKCKLNAYVHTGMHMEVHAGPRKQPSGIALHALALNTCASWAEEDSPLHGFRNWYAPVNDA